MLIKVHSFIIRTLIKTFAFSFICLVSVAAQVVQEDAPQLQNIDVEEHLGEYVPLNLIFTDENGNKVTLGEYFNQGKPVLLGLVYYECPMLCNLIFNGLVQTVRELDWQPGEEFQMVSVSINPAETYQLAASKKQNYLQALDIPSATNGWSFLVGDENQSKALADAVGFKYYYDEEQKQYAHPAVIYLIADDGKITRYLYGIEFKKQALHMAILEASQGKIGSTLDKLILYCYHYDPDAGEYVVFAGNVMRLGGIITVVCLGLFIGLLWYRERHKKNKRITV